MIIDTKKIRKRKRKVAVENKEEVRVSVQGERGQKNNNRQKDTKTNECTAFCWLRTRRVQKIGSHTNCCLRVCSARDVTVPHLRRS
jgi:hypothetical protein